MQREPPPGTPSPRPSPIFSTHLAGADEARVEDVSSIDAIIRAAYASVSFTGGSGPDGPRLSSLLTRDAKLIAVLPAGETQDGGVGEFLERVRERIRTTGLTEFVERELFRRTEVYGAIAHVFSSYEGRTCQHEGGAVLVRGINSFQLRHDGRRWWILSILWTDEHPQNPIPAAYLPRT